eukprot:757436-Hanusia_phi.AAC.1
MFRSSRTSNRSSRGCYLTLKLTCTPSASLALFLSFAVSSSSTSSSSDVPPRPTHLLLSCTAVVDKIQCLRSAIQAFIFHQVDCSSRSLAHVLQTPYGRYVRADELTGDPLEDICTICHDPVTAADPCSSADMPTAVLSRPRAMRPHLLRGVSVPGLLLLPSRHGRCVHQWLQRERTCPLCRSIVRNARQRLRTDGSTSILPVIF